MPNNNNGIPIEVKKPFETVYEIKNEVPNFEEFVKNYENDGKVNYDDLSGGEVGEVIGYGPCASSCCSCSSYELRRQLQQTKEELDNFGEKFKEYDGEGEKYKKAVDNFFSEMEEARNNPVRQVMDNPVTSFVSEFLPPNPFTIKYNGDVQAMEGAIEARGKEKRKSCYSEIVKTYNQIRDGYCQIRNR